MRTALCVLVTLTSLATPLFAQAPSRFDVPGQVRLQNPDAANKNGVDRPVGGVQVRIGPATNNGNSTDPLIVIDRVLPPDIKDEPTFYGEPVGDNFVLILDASGSMAGARAASLRAEATSLIARLDEDNKFDCMSYGTQFADSTMQLWRGLTVATESNKDAATNFVNGPCCNPGYGTPTHAALQRACETYPVELGKMFLITDGVPNATGSAMQILQHFPGWWSKFDPRTALVCVCVGGIEEAINFMRDLAAQDDSTGVFINVP
ncbi:MAG: hypothetical protein IT462_00010 [Planctomycetes bacterium]|nr:hypothetical protein [Planctomycetota bacterium]